jgi:hypothetical protein
MSDPHNLDPKVLAKPDSELRDLQRKEALLQTVILLAAMQARELEEIKAKCEILTNNQFSVDSRADMLERRERAHEQRAHLLDLRQERLDLRESESA